MLLAAASIIIGKTIAYYPNAGHREIAKLLRFSISTTKQNYRDKRPGCSALHTAVAEGIMTKNFVKFHFNANMNLNKNSIVFCRI